MATTGASDHLKGYHHPGYAASLAEFGAPRRLARSGGSVLVRPVGGLPYQDAMGCYPLFCCDDWFGLPGDFAELQHDLVAISLVTDPFARCDVAYLQNIFRDKVSPFRRTTSPIFGARPGNSCRSIIGRMRGNR